MGKQDDAVRGLEQAAAITKACAAAGIQDPAEIPALVTFAKVAEDFNCALVTYQHAQHNYNQFVATHHPDDPGQEYYVAQVTAAREIYALARQVHAVALESWRGARGLDSVRAAA